MKTYTFKPEFEQKLKTLKIKSKFFSNIRADCAKYGYDFESRCNLIDGLLTWEDFIMTAFPWPLVEVDFWIFIRDSEIKGIPATFSRK